MRRVFAGLAAAVLLTGVLAACGAAVPSAPCGHHVPAAMKSFARAVMHRIGASPTKANIASFNCWAHMEGSKATWNPLATTMPARGSSCFNSVCVRNYRSRGSGIRATAKTIRNYGDILSRFQGGYGVCGSSGDFSTWSGGGYSQVC